MISQLIHIYVGVTCETPTLAHGTVTGGGGLFPATDAQYTCYAGYTLVGAATTSCSATGVTRPSPLPPPLFTHILELHIVEVVRPVHMMHVWRAMRRNTHEPAYLQPMPHQCLRR